MLEAESFNQYLKTATPDNKQSFHLKSAFLDRLEIRENVYLQRIHYLEELLEKSNQKLVKRKDRIMVKVDKSYKQLVTDEIEYIEAFGDYVKIFINNKYFLVSASLKRIEPMLHSDDFVRVHRSTIVNKKFIRELIPHFNGEYIIKLSTGASLKWSRGYRETALDFMNEFLIG